MIDAFPLSWPTGWPRTRDQDRRRARFFGTERKTYSWDQTKSYLAKRDVSVHEATQRVLAELERMGIEPRSAIISTNVELRQDGLPRSNRRAPDDPGVAVYWNDPINGKQCMAIDLYDSVAGNLAAVAATLDAMRAIERHGGAQILKRAFSGFKALPSATTTALNAETAARVLASRSGAQAVDDRIEMILNDADWAKDAARRASARTHPDAGGRTDDFQLVQEAKRVLQAHHGVEL